MHIYIYLFGGVNKGDLGYVTCDRQHSNASVQHNFITNNKSINVSAGQTIAVYSQMVSSNFSGFYGCPAYTFWCRFYYTLTIKVTV